jgi:hypothetical protein
MADLLAQASHTPIFDVIPNNLLEPALQTHPFLPLPGALNIRTLDSPGRIKPNLIFRSGNLAWWPAASVEALHSTYGIATIFDLRSERETKTEPTTIPDGVQVVWFQPVRRPLAIGIEEFAGDGVGPAYGAVYADNLEVYAATVKALFEHLRDQPGVPILFHCNGEFPISVK